MTAVLCADVLTAPLGPLGSLGGVPDGELGLWEAGPGTETDVEVDEVFVVLAGEATVQVDGGPTLDLRPGVVVRLHAGDRTTWTTTERLRKLYLSGDAPASPGAAVELAPHALVRLGEGDRTEWTVTETVRALVITLPG